MTSSNDPWQAGTRPAMRATRWAPAELHSEPSVGSTPGADAEPDLADTLAETRAEAFGEGFAEGERQQAHRLASAISMFEEAVSQIRAQRPAWLDNVEKNVITLAVAVARQILGRELETDQDSIAQLVSRALTRFPVEEPLTVRLHPSDLSRISAAALEGPGSDPAAGRDVRWRADAHIDVGSCVVEGPERMVDGRVDKALLRIYQALVTDE